MQETADGKVVVFHDSDVMRLAGVGVKIWDATMADLQTIDIGSRFSTAFKDERGMASQIVVMSLELAGILVVKPDIGELQKGGRDSEQPVLLAAGPFGKGARSTPAK